MIPGAQTSRRGEWIWLTGPSGLHRNSPQGLNVSSIRVFDQIRYPEILITLRSLFGHNFFQMKWFFLLAVGMPNKSFYISPRRIIVNFSSKGGEGRLGFPDLWSGQKHWWNWYLTPVVNFGEVRRAQLAKSTLLTSSLVPLGSFRIL